MMSIDATPLFVNYWYSEKILKWFKTKFLLCKGGMRKIFAFMKFFDCLVTFWTLPYGPKAQWSNSQRAKSIGFFQGKF